MEHIKPSETSHKSVKTEHNSSCTPYPHTLPQFNVVNGLLDVGSFILFMTKYVPLVLDRTSLSTQLV
jgi:hypothetical protein